MEQLELNLEETTREIKEKLNTVAENFVFVGYRLRQILDTGVFADAGYTNIYEYAEKELSLNVTAVSRFIAINKKYSVGGYGQELKEQFKGYGSSKLAEMLTMTEADCAVISTDTPVKQIREYKNFLKDEQKEDDGQISISEEKEGNSDGLKELLMDYFGRNMDILRRILDTTATAEILQEQMNPTGVHNIGYKTSFLMLRDLQHGVMYRQFGRKPEEMTWEELLNKIRELVGPEYETMAEMEREKKKKQKEKTVATSQIKGTEHKAKEHEEEVEKEQGNVEQEEQIPGQTELEDYPEILPEKKPESLEKSLTDEDSWKEEQRKGEMEEKEKETEKNGAKNEKTTVDGMDLFMRASELFGMVQKKDYEAAVEQCENLLILLKRKVHEDE